jgi:hypothetical protein
MAPSTPARLRGVLIRICSRRVDGLNHSSDVLSAQGVAALSSSHAPWPVMIQVLEAARGTVTGVSQPPAACRKMRAVPDDPNAEIWHLSKLSDAAAHRNRWPSPCV